MNQVWVPDMEGYCSVDQYVFRVQGDAVPAYVAAFLRSPTFLERAPITETPGQLPRIRLDEVLSVRLRLPQPAEQKRTASRLSDQLLVARASEEVEGQVRLSSALATAAMQSCFGDFRIPAHGAARRCRGDYGVAS